MLSLLPRPLLLLIAACAVPIFAIRAHPYDDSALRALLTPPADCPAPCFMGIRPGVTTLWEALELLDQHGWVARLGAYDFENSQNPDGTVTIMLTWEWSGAQPGVIDSSRSGSLWVLDDLIVSIDVVTRLQQGDIQLALGLPDKEQFITVRGPQGDLYTHYAWYETPSLMIIADNRCPARELSRNRVMFHWSEKPLEFPALQSVRQICG